MREQLLPTPRASDGTKGSPAQRGTKGDLTLPAAAIQLLPTLTAARHGSNRSTSKTAAVQPGLDTIGHLLHTAESHGTKQKNPMVRRYAWGPYQQAVNRWEQILGRPAPAPTQPGSTGSPVLAPALVEWMMGLPPGWVTDPRIGLARTAALRMLGNGVVTHQAILALRMLLCPHRWRTGL